MFFHKGLDILIGEISQRPLPTRLLFYRPFPPKADDNDSVNSDEEEGLSDEEDDEDGSDSDSDGDRNAQDLLPDDLYANNLNSRYNIQILIFSLNIFRPRRS